MTAPRPRRHSFFVARVRLAPVAAAAVATIVPLVAATDHASAGTTGVTFSTVDANGYGVDDLNAVSVSRNALVTVGGFQYLAYYQYNAPATGTIEVARRATGTNAWSYLNTGITISAGADNVSTDSIITNGIDDHDVVAMGIDGNGAMHLSWGMHNHTLNYSISNAPVNGTASAFSSTAFTKQTSANNTALFSQLGTINQVTYPEFYYEQSGGSPNGNLLFDYRNAASASGGGSGNGNTFFTTYNAGTNKFTNDEEVLDGGATSVNAYQNSLAYGPNGGLQMTWTWRASPAYQTNQDIMFAQSPDNGVTWFKQGGTTQYALPVVASQVSGTTAAQVAQVVQNVAQGTSLINNTSMTTDANSNPIMATWYTPNGNANNGAVSPTNNPNRQYVLVYYDGAHWRTSQISNRTNDAAFDTSGADVRDLGRPVVLTDKQGRVLVVTRSEDIGLDGGAFNAAQGGNNIVVYWNTVASLDGATPAAWQKITLDTANMGEWEPSYDPLLWSSKNELDMLYEPVGFSGQTTGTVSVLQWDDPAYFASLPEPTGLMTMLALSAPVLLSRRRPTRDRPENHPQSAQSPQMRDGRDSPSSSV